MMKKYFVCVFICTHVYGWYLPLQSQQTPISELCEDPLVGSADTMGGDDQQAFLSEISEEDVEVLRQREEALLQIEVCIWLSQ